MLAWLGKISKLQTDRNKDWLVYSLLMYCVDSNWTKGTGEKGTRQEINELLNLSFEKTMDQSSLNVQHDHTVTITVCVGSSCHLRGSHKIIQLLKELIRSSTFGRKVILKGSFCMDNCTEGVSVKINEELFSIGSIGEMKELFQNKVASTFGR